MTDVGLVAITAGAGLLGAAIPTTANYLSERRRTKELREFRNHDKRTDVALQYFEKLSDFRRAAWDLARAYTADPDTYDSKHGQVVDAARDVADLATRVKLWFDRPVADAEKMARECVERMQKHAEQMHRHPPSDGGEAWEKMNSLDREQKELGDRVVEAMKVQLEPPASR